MTDSTVNPGIAHGLYTEGDPVADTKALAALNCAVTSLRVAGDSRLASVTS